jgi:hypothetical protein
LRGHGLRLIRLAVALGLLVLGSQNLSMAEDRLSPTETGKGKVLEELRYRVNIWMWPDAVKTRVVLRELAPGRYQAEMSGTTQGFLAVLSGNWQGSLSTEMIYANGKLLPLVYREASQNRRRKTLKEYRFDYDQKKVELWTLKKDGSLKKRWETTFTEPFQDPLSFFYNRRLDGDPMSLKGKCLKLKGIPYPKPEEIVLRVGERSPEGLKVMVEIENRVMENERLQIYGFVDDDGVPTRAWTRVLLFGRVNAELLPESKKAKLPQLLGADSEVGLKPTAMAP